jgi:hypothetical protein
MLSGTPRETFTRTKLGAAAGRMMFFSLEALQPANAANRTAVGINALREFDITYFGWNITWILYTSSSSKAA